MIALYRIYDIHQVKNWGSARFRRNTLPLPHERLLAFPFSVAGITRILFYAIICLSPLPVIIGKHYPSTFWGCSYFGING